MGTGHTINPELGRLLAQGAALGFYDTAQLRASLGYARPHLLSQDLSRLRRSGYVVMRGEGVSNSLDRWAHRRGDHNWQPDAVIIMTRRAFKSMQARMRAQQQWRGPCAYIPIGGTDDQLEVNWINRKPAGGGHRQRVAGEYAEHQRRASVGARASREAKGETG